MTKQEDEARQEGRFADTEAWRRHIDTAVVGLQQQMTVLTANVSSALTIHSSNAEQIAANTRITLDLKTSLDNFQTRAMPAIEVTETMQRGATAIGKTLEFISLWGRRAWKVTMFALGVWIAVKIMVSGGSWGDAVKAFFSAQAH